MPKFVSPFDRRVNEALCADDERIRLEELAKKLAEDAKKKRANPDDGERKVVRSEQPLYDETNTNYMHDNPDQDGYLRPYLAWRYALKQLGTDSSTVIADPRPYNERAYPLLNCELHGHQIWMHQAQPDVTPQKSTTVTPAFGNFMYSKMVSETPNPRMSQR